MKVWVTRIIKSKTMLFNMFVALAASLEGVFNILQPVIPGNVYAYVTVILTVGNAVLRVYTNQPLSDK